MTRPNDALLGRLAGSTAESETEPRPPDASSEPEQEPESVPPATGDSELLAGERKAKTLAPLMDVERLFEPGSPLLALEDVNLGYGGMAVLQQVNMQIRAGEFWCLLGPNGEGKTTLIKSLLGALKPQRGRIRQHPDIRRSGRIGYVPQHLELNPVLPTSVREFVLSGLVGLPRRRGLTEDERLRRILELIGLPISAKQNFWTLSGGQKQRVLVGRALIRSPRLLIVDEPTAGLDFAASGAVLGMLRDLHSQFGVTIVFVTHDLQIAAELADHIALIRRGRVVCGPRDSTMTADNLDWTYGVPVHVESSDNGIRVRHQALRPPVNLAESMVQRERDQA